MPWKCLSPAYYYAVIFVLASSCSQLGSYQDEVSPLPIPSSSPYPAPVHLWSFDNNANDSVGTWNGTLNSPASYTSAAGSVQSASFAALDISGAGSFGLGVVTLPAQMTIACWVRWIQSGSGFNTIFANATAGGDGLELYVVESSGQVVLETGNGTSSLSVNSGSTNLVSSTYAFVAATLDTAGNTGAIYINGTLVNSGATETGPSLAAATYIGSMPSSTSPFNGDLDACQIFNSVLSASEVTALYGTF